MKTKKVLSLGLSVLMLGSLLVGCGNKDKDTSTAEGKTLTIAGLDGGYGTEGWKKVIEKFEQDNGVKVNATFDKKISDVVRPKITAGKDVPDIIYLTVGGVGGLTDTLIKEKQIADISALLDTEIPGESTKVKDKILSSFVQGATADPYGDGKLYLAPFTYDPCGLFYNAGLFEQKGWTVPTTWDEMWELGEKAKAEGIALFTYPTTGYFDAFFSALLNETVGADAYTKLMEYDTKTWQSAETKKAFEIVGKLAQYTEANTVANANKDNFTKNQQLILDNKALFCPNGTWLPDEMSEAPRAEGFKWGFMALPKVSAEGDSYSSTFSEQVYIPSKAKNADLAKKFITFMYSDEAAKLFAEESGCVLPTTTASSYLPEKVKDKDGNEIDNQKTLFYQIYDNGAKSCTVGFKSVDAIEGVDLTSAEGILYGTVNSVVTGDKTVDEWYNAVIDAVKKYDK